MTFLLGETAAESKNPSGLKASCNSLTNSANPCFSSGFPFVQST